MARCSSETSMEFTKLDLPEPVAPATSRCGVLARLAVTKPPSTSLPSPMTSGCWSVRASGAARTSPSRTISRSEFGHLDADRGLAGDRGEQSHVVGGHRVGDVPGERGDLLHLDARPELDLVPGDRRAAGEPGDGGVDVELLEHAGDALDHLVVGRGSLLRRGAQLEQRGRRQLVLLAADLVEGELGGPR